MLLLLLLLLLLSSMSVLYQGSPTYMQQSAFLIFFQGDRLKKKVQLICDRLC